MRITTLGLSQPPPTQKPAKRRLPERLTQAIKLNARLVVLAMKLRPNEATTAESKVDAALREAGVTWAGQTLKGLKLTVLHESVGGLASAATGFEEYFESTAQTGPGRVVDAVVGSAVDFAFAAALPAVAAVEAVLNVTLPHTAPKVKALSGGFIGGNLTTAVRAVVTVGESVVTRNPEGPRQFDRHAAKGDYGLLFQGVSKGVHGIEHGVHDLEQGVEHAMHGVEHAAQRVEHGVEHVVDDFATWVHQP